MNIPGGIFSIKLPYNTKQPFLWPVSLHDTEEIRKEVEILLANIVSSIEYKQARDIYLVAFKYLLIEFLSLVHGCMIVKHEKETNNRFIFPQQYRLFLGLQQNGVPYDDGVVCLKMNSEKTGFGARNIQILRRLKSHYQLSGFKGLYSSCFDPATITVVGYSPIMYDTLKYENSRPVCFLYKEQLQPKSNKALSTELKKELHEISGLIQEKVLSMLTSKGWIPNKELGDYIFNKSRDFLEKTANDYVHVEKLWEKRTPRTLWTGSGGNYWERISRAIVQKNGGEVVGFDHGGPSCVFYSKGFHMTLGLFADRFITFTKATADLYVKHSQSWWPFGLPQLKVESCGPLSNSYLKDIIDCVNIEHGNGSIKKVMCVDEGNPGEIQSLYSLTDDYVYLDWKVRLADFLSSAGFEVLIKPDPGGVLKGKTFEYSQKCKFLKGHIPVETLWSDTDSLLFDSTGSAFWHALCTRIPMVLIDFGQYQWNHEAYILLKKRCSIVKAYFDENNRIQVDFKKIEECLKNPIKEPDMSFVHRYIKES